MGCDIVVAGASAREREAVAALFARWDGVFSRFRPGSELNAVNAAAGRVVSVSPLFARVLRVALDAAVQTDGLVDPTLGVQLEAAGYDRDFPLLENASRPPVRRPTAEAARWRSVRADGRLVLVPDGVRLDLNGVVKSLAVDEALDLLDGPGWIGAGGDLATRRPLAVELPGGGSVMLVAGGLATSGSARRAWTVAGRRLHHLIDPATGLPSASAWEQVTVCGAICLGADVAAKAAFLAGPAWLEERRLAGRFLGADGTVVLTDGWSRGAGAAA
jgi:thiamine biosynthesis lipoprotein